MECAGPQQNVDDDYCACRVKAVGGGYSYNRGPHIFLNRGPARSKSGPVWSICASIAVDFLTYRGTCHEFPSTTFRALDGVPHFCPKLRHYCTILLFTKLHSTPLESLLPFRHLVDLYCRFVVCDSFSLANRFPNRCPATVDKTTINVVSDVTEQYRQEATIPV